MTEISVFSHFTVRKVKPGDFKQLAVTIQLVNCCSGILPGLTGAGAVDSSHRTSALSSGFLKMGLQKELGSGDSLATLLDPWEAGEPRLQHLPYPLFSLFCSK